MPSAVVTWAPEAADNSCGFIILALGKLGARDLNYSSDIDLIIFYDPEKTPYQGRKDTSHFAVQLARKMVKRLSEVTADGFVFRVDLRLRPDAALTPLAINLEAALSYYESTALSWERAAFIKARPVAGDIAAGAKFLSDIRSFVWRRHLDYAAIDDVMATTRRMRDSHGKTTPSLIGHNLKLDRGGIREIEFFAQTFQMISGGRDLHLRRMATADVLAALGDHDYIDRTKAAQLIDAYWFLRHLEHRLQMLNDDQTQTLPKQEEALLRFCRFAGFEDIASLQSKFDETFSLITGAYNDLFEDATPEISGDENDTASKAVIEKWESGTYRALASDRARSVMRQAVPDIMAALKDSGNYEEALDRFDRLLSRLPAGVQFFSLLRAHPHLIQRIVQIQALAPSLALQLERKPTLLDALIGEDIDPATASPETLEADLNFQLASARHFEEILDQLRIWAGDLKFRVSVDHLDGKLNWQSAGRAHANIADVCIRGVWPHIFEEFRTKHGDIPGGGFAVLGFGKLGSQDLTSTSDLDLAFLFEADPAAKSSDGEKPLAIGQYYTRLGQRLINALSALTGEGQLYEIDMRMRPQGRKGPLVTSIDAFERYYSEEAWTYEHMALVRARVIKGSPILSSKIEDVIRSVLTTERDAADIAYNALTMRDRVQQHFGTSSIWRMKHADGGLMDLDFILHSLALAHPDAPHRHPTQTPELIADLLASEALSAEDAETLSKASNLMREVQALNRLTTEAKFDPETASDGLKALLCQATDHDDLPDLEKDIAAAQSSIRALFDKYVRDRAAQADDEDNDGDGPTDDILFDDA